MISQMMINPLKKMLTRMKECNIGADASGCLADKPTGVETMNEVGSRLCKDPGRGFQAEGSASVKTLEALTAQGGQ